MNLQELNYIALGLVLISFLWNIKKFEYNQSKLYFVAFLVLIFTEIAANIEFYTYGLGNTIIYQIGIDLCYGLLVLFFYYTLLKRKNVVLILIILHAIFNIGFIAYNYSISNDYESLNLNIFENYGYCYFFNSIIFLIVIIQYIMETFNSDAILNLKNYFPAWISASLLINVVGHIPIYLNLVNMESEMDVFTFFNIFINVISYLFLIVGIFYNKNTNEKVRIY